MPCIHLTSKNDPVLAAYTQLTARQLQARGNPSSAKLILESQFVIKTALERGYPLESILVCREHFDTLMSTLEPFTAAISELPIYTLPKEEMSTLVGFSVHRGYFACVPRPLRRTIASLNLSSASLICVLETISDVSNIGALFRSAAAFGVDGIILNASCADPYNRRSVRTSMGAVLSLPWAQAATPTSHTWASDTACVLSSHGFVNIACALDEKAMSLNTVQMQSIAKKALWFGSEGWGLSQEARAACDMSVMIPMQRGIDSLNVAASSAVFFWECARSAR